MRHLWSFFVLSIACSGATDDTTDTDSDVIDTEPDIQWECQIPEGKEPSSMVTGRLYGRLAHLERPARRCVDSRRTLCEDGGGPL